MMLDIDPLIYLTRLATGGVSILLHQAEGLTTHLFGGVRRLPYGDSLLLALSGTSMMVLSAILRRIQSGVHRGEADQPATQLLPTTAGSRAATESSRQ